RAALIRGLGADDTYYQLTNLNAQPLNAAAAEGEHIRSFQLAVAKIDANPASANFAIHSPGPLTDVRDEWPDLARVYADGLGEVGLDASPRYYKSLDAQREVFAEILVLCAATPKKVLSVHCVRAFKDMFALLDAHWGAAAGSLVFHWFSGSVSDARRAVERGC